MADTSAVSSSPAPETTATSNSTSSPGFKTNPPPTDRPVRVYADGIYDLFHFGHARSLEHIQTVAMHRNEWVENADRLVAGFLEMFEEGCHKMGTAIRDRIQERLRGQQSQDAYMLENGSDGNNEEYYDEDGEEEEYYYDDDEFYEEKEKK